MRIGHKLFSILLLLTLSSCGFRAIYSTNKLSPSDQEEYKQELASIKIRRVKKHLDQQLKNNLEEILNPYHLKVESQYLLSIDLTQTTSSAFTTSTGSSGRNKVILTATYELRDLESGEIIAKGFTNAIDDFDIESRIFANYIAEESLGLNLTKILAQNIRNLLVNDILQNEKKKTEKEEDRKKWINQGSKN